MPLKTVTVQGRQCVLGRKPPKSKERNFLSAQSLLGSTVPTPPSTIAVPSSCANGLSQTFMNTELGCCVMAHHAHFLANITSQTGKPFIYTDKQIISDYSAVGDTSQATHSVIRAAISERTSLTFKARDLLTGPSCSVRSLSIQPAGWPSHKVYG